MHLLRLHLPAVSLLVVCGVYLFVGQTYVSAVVSIVASLCALCLCAAVVRNGSILSPKEWKLSQWLLCAFVLAVSISAAFSGSILHSVFGFVLDMTSVGFLVLIGAASLTVSSLPFIARRGLFVASIITLLCLLLYPYIRSEHVVRPSFSTTFSVESAAYADRGGKVLLVGMGPGSFTYAWQKYRPEEVLTTPFWSEDFSVGSGTLPTMVIEFGVIAALLLVLCFISAVVEESIQIFTSANTTHQRLMSLASVVAMVMTLAMLVYAEPSAPLLLSGFVLLGSCRHEDGASIRLPLIFRRGALGIVGLGILGVLYLGLSVIFYFYAYVHIQNNDLLHARSTAEYAYALSPSGQTSRLLAQVLRSSGHALGDAAAPQATVGQLFHLASKYARAATVHESGNAQSWKLLGISLAEEFSLAPTEQLFLESDGAFGQARFRAPTDPSIVFFQAQLYILAGQRQKAQEALKIALTLRPAYTEAQDLLNGLQGI